MRRFLVLINGIFRIILEALRLDIFDICWVASSEYIDYFHLRPDPLPAPSMRERYKKAWRSLSRTSCADTVKMPSDPPDTGVAFFMTTKNQSNALSPLTEGLKSVTRQVITENTVPLGVITIISLPFFPIFIYRYLHASTYQRQAMRYLPQWYWLSYGYYIFFRFLLRRGITAVIMANDHSRLQRAMLKAANDERIQTFYIQHASVTSKFPPLEFTYALLDGQDAMEKYDAIGQSQTHVFLVGIMKLDAYIASTREPAIIPQRVGICTNILDPLARVKELCAALVTTHRDIKFILRPHPSDTRLEIWAEIAAQFSMTLSDSRHQTALDFLRDDVDMILAGETNILLEACLLNNYALYYDFGMLARDSYGFYKNGLVGERLENPVQASAAISTAHEDNLLPRMRAKRYCSTLGTVYEGKSTELALTLIRHILNGNKIPPNGWQRIASTENLEAYTFTRIESK